MQLLVELPDAYPASEGPHVQLESEGPVWLFGWDWWERYEREDGGRYVYVVE